MSIDENHGQLRGEGFKYSVQTPNKFTNTNIFDGDTT